MFTETPDITILVEFPDESGLVQASLPGDLAKRSKEALDNAMTTIVSMAQRIGELRDHIPNEFTQAEVTFGVKLTWERKPTP